MGDTKKEYYIYVQGEQVSVSYEIYCAYYEEYDHERYLDKRGRQREISLDSLQELGDLFYFTGQLEVNLDCQIVKKELLNQLYEALKHLTGEERWLIEKLYFYECQEKEVAAILGVSRQAVNKRKQKILKKLGDILN